MTRLELDPEEQELLQLLLTKELEETRVEVRHTDTAPFKAQLLERERRIQALAAKLG